MSRIHRLLAWINRKLPPPTEGKLHKLVEKDRTPIQELKNVIEAKDPITKGRKAFELGKYTEALATFEEAIEDNPENSWAWHGRGDSLQLLGEAKGALAAYEQAVSLDSSIGLHHGGRANSLQALGRKKEAKEAMRIALQLDPSLGWMKP